MCADVPQIHVDEDRTTIKTVINSGCQRGNRGGMTTILKSFLSVGCERAILTRYSGHTVWLLGQSGGYSADAVHFARAGEKNRDR